MSFSSYFFYSFVRVIYVEITLNDPHVFDIKYLIPDIQKVYRMIILQEKQQGISEIFESLEILEKKIKEDYYCKPYEGMTNYTYISYMVSILIRLALLSF